MNPARFSGAHNPENADLNRRLGYAYEGWLSSVSPSTAKYYRRHLKYFFEFIGGLPEVTKTNSLVIEDFLRRTCPNSANSFRNIRLASIKSFFRALERHGLVQYSPAQALRIRSKPNKHHPAVAKELVEEGLSLIKAIENPILKARNYAIALLLLNNGLRRSELTGIKVKDLCGAELTLKGKGGRIDCVPLSDRTLKAIMEWLKIYGKNRIYLFPSYSRNTIKDVSMGGDAIWDLTKKYFQCSPHQLRARSITDLYLNAGCNLFLAMIHARHTSGVVTEKVYIQTEKAKQAGAFQPNYQ